MLELTQKSGGKTKKKREKKGFFCHFNALTRILKIYRPRHALGALEEVVGDTTWGCLAAGEYAVLLGMGASAGPTGERG